MEERTKRLLVDPHHRRQLTDVRTLLLGIDPAATSFLCDEHSTRVDDRVCHRQLSDVFLPRCPRPLQLLCDTFNSDVDRVEGQHWIAFFPFSFDQEIYFLSPD